MTDTVDCPGDSKDWRSEHTEYILHLLAELCNQELGDPSRVKVDFDERKRKGENLFDILKAFRTAAGINKSDDEMRKVLCCDYTVFKRGTIMEPQHQNVHLLRQAWEIYEATPVQRLRNQDG